MKYHSQGFTLIEVIIVMAILGVVSSIFFWGLNGQLQKSRLQNAVTGFSSDLQRARSTAWRSGQTTAVALLTNGKGYTFSQTTQPTKTILFPEGVTAVADPPVASTVTYIAPFAENANAIGVKFTLSMPNEGPKDTVRVFGVTGKVIR